MPAVARSEHGSPSDPSRSDARSGHHRAFSSPAGPGRAPSLPDPGAGWARGPRRRAPLRALGARGALEPGRALEAAALPCDAPTGIEWAWKTRLRVRGDADLGMMP